jgi:hypothetical protein
VNLQSNSVAVLLSTACYDTKYVRFDAGKEYTVFIYSDYKYKHLISVVSLSSVY